MAIVVTIVSLALSPSILSMDAAGQTQIMSPRQQMEAGVDANDVVCKEGLVLMIRATNGAAACVKPSTSEKLSSAGWGEIVEMTATEGEAKEIALEEKVGISSDESDDEDSVKKVEIEEEVGTEAQGP